MKLEARSLSAFLAIAPDARPYAKPADSRRPCVAFRNTDPLSVGKPWGPGGSTIDVDANPATHCLLANLAIGEVYPVALAPSGLPVGYVPTGEACPIPGGLVVASEPVWASCLVGEATLSTKEGETHAPAGAWLCYSNAKGLYHVTPEKWAAMGYAPTQEVTP